MTSSVEEWLERLAGALGVEPPSAEEVALLLELAGRSARASERRAAPVSCWLAARSGRSLEEALAAAVELSDAPDEP